MSANKQIVKNIICNIAVFIINSSITFFLSPYLIRTLGKEAYSFYPLISNIVQYSNIINTAIGSMAGRFITIEIYGDRIKEAEGYFNSVLLSNWILSLFFSVLTLLGVIFISNILSVPDYLLSDVRWIFFLCSISMILLFNSDLFGLGTYVKNRIDLNSMMRMAAAVTNVTFIIFLFSLFSPSIVYIGIAALASALVSIVINFYLKRVLLPELQIKPFKTFSFTKIRLLVTSGIWNSINQLSNVLLTHIDLLITNVFIGAAATGDFALVKMAPNLIYTLLALLSGSFIPNFNILYAQKKTGELLHEIKKSMKIVGILICVPIGFLLIFAGEFFQLWVPSIDSDYLLWLSFITVLPMILGSSINPIFGVFTITNKLKIPSLVLLLAGVMNTLAIFVLLKTTELGIWSIPIVSAFQQGLRNFFFTPIYASVCLKQKLYTFYPTLFKCCLALGIVCVVGIILKELLIHVTWTMLVIKAFLLFVISLFINMYIILNRNERSFIKTKTWGIVRKYCFF